MWVLALLSLAFAGEETTTMQIAQANTADTSARVFDPPRLPGDARVEAVRETNTDFTMPPFNSKADWETYAANLRRRILVSSGLWPLPERTPLNPEIVEVAKHDDYIVEKVRFEARPGYLVTGNLYRPVGDGPFPGVANPHGHWEHGRLENTEKGCIAARCITFARMGMVAFSYDMVGYNDSLQLEHKWGGEREKLWGLHPFAVQLWSSIRVLDFLESLPYVDANRLACTGASGGGTQTFILTAVDPRVKVAAPVNMISHTMQGGCLCENAPIIRFNASNMEIGALAAPRPLLMVCCTGDWTKETPQVEYPAIRSIYELYGAADNLETIQIDADHNYNKASREAVYRFFGKHILGEGERYKDFTEPPYTMEPDAALLVFPDKKLPDGYPQKDDVIKNIIEATRAKVQAAFPKDAAGLDAFRKEFAPALGDVFGVSVPETVSADALGRDAKGGYTVERMVLHRAQQGDAIPALLFRPEAPPAGAVLVVHGKGKAALFDSNGKPGALVLELLKTGKVVLAIDAFLTGEHHLPNARTERRYGAFPDTFMPTDTAYRVQDIVTAAAYLRSASNNAQIDLVGLGEGGLWCLFASAFDSGIGKIVADMAKFNNTDDAAWVERYYVPCIRSIGDAATAAAMIAPRPLWLTNTADSFDASSIQGVYDAASAATLAIAKHEVGPSDVAARLRQP